VIFTFNKYLSLGNTCKTRHQLDRIFSSRFEGYHPTKGYFDWLWGGGIDGVIKVIQKDFFISADNLVVKKHGAGTQVYDESTGFYFLHDFVFSKEGLLDLKIANHEMLNQLEAFMQKYTVMAEKTRALFKSEERICFVYCGRLNRAQIGDFLSVTTEIFRAKPVLLNIAYFNEVPNNEEISGYEDSLQIRIVNDEAVKGTPGEWMGVNESWDKAFQDFSLI